MQLIEVGYCVVLLVVANGAPVIAADLLKERWKWPLDAGHAFFDGQPWFGYSKTWRGIIVAMVAASLAAALLGIGWQIGMAFATLAMGGDLLASFIKRRLRIVVSGRAWFLDQLPESMLPTFLLSHSLDLSFLEASIAVGIFTLLDLIGSPILYHLHLRKRPY